MPKLVTWMNNQRVGELTKLANGAHTFKYAAEWLASRYARPLSLSLPLQRGNITYGWPCKKLLRIYSGWRQLSAHTI